MKKGWRNKRGGGATREGQHDERVRTEMTMMWRGEDDDGTTSWCTAGSIIMVINQL